MLGCVFELLLSSLQGAFSALNKICEDCSDQFNSEELAQSLEVLIPKFIQFFGHSSPNIKSNAIACVNQFVICQPPALVANILPFIRVCVPLYSHACCHFLLNSGFVRSIRRWKCWGQEECVQSLGHVAGSTCDGSPSTYATHHWSERGTGWCTFLMIGISYSICCWEHKILMKQLLWKLVNSGWL